jgi:hypothetical protein
MYGAGLKSGMYRHLRDGFENCTKSYVKHWCCGVTLAACGVFNIFSSWSYFYGWYYSFIVSLRGVLS